MDLTETKAPSEISQVTPDVNMFKNQKARQSNLKTFRELMENENKFSVAKVNAVCCWQAL